ncbi:Extradiol ring-cleavage dioxygenase class III enzyme subunit B [Venturia nashicola]|uniref:Extradiol ring-cleavage dioxygenase class III enzyme subunit B n=1 Tax=Venturia nashicola TaxID=86259 RepID=A0A4Z1NU58_9PEZI|nr:Extradiol ring-cleavage dioxygenase class III enzyme subunit B [Venturia nashicola]TLD27732.1 Extradiol ring-cleavage dioxygenase class III enzyme subunit B [Venturia nashicola]
MTKGVVVSFAHGGGPLPLMNDPMTKEIIYSLKNRVPKILRLDTPKAPRAIILITAHWSEKVPTISNADKHKLYYDYGGFPPEMYKVKYDAPGSPAVAKEVFDTLQTAGLKPDTNSERGWDHGVFVPMILVYPKANIPIIQLSVLSSEDPATHIKMGEALSILRESNIAIIGSGFSSFHNLRLMFSGIHEDSSFRRRNKDWNNAVKAAIEEEDVEKRKEKLGDWRKFPNAYEMHPRGGAEHFLPLVVCAGAGGAGKAKSYTDKFLGLDMYSFYWDEE